MYISFILFLGLNFYWFVYTETSLDNHKNFGFFRYELYGNLRDTLYHEGLEHHVFAYTYRFPHLYVYGISGYTKINVFPLYTHIEKIPNEQFYNMVENNDSYKERVSYSYTTYSRLLKKYGNSIKIYDSLKEASEEDYMIYKMLQQKGNWRKTGEIFFNTPDKDQKLVIQGLDVLDF